MAAPNRAPRRTVQPMSTNTAAGVPVPGAAAGTYNRKSIGLNPNSVPHTKGGHVDGPSGACYDEYNGMRSGAKVGLNPSNVAVNKDSSPRPL